LWIEKKNKEQQYQSFFKLNVCLGTSHCPILENLHLVQNALENTDHQS
jgi:hypothetical protein